MRVPLGTDGWYLCDRSYHSDHDYTEFRGTSTHALQLINQFRGDRYVFEALRRQLPGGLSLSDAELAHEVAWRLTTREWRARHFETQWAASSGTAPPEPPPPPSAKPVRAATPPRTPTPEREGAVFPSDTDMDAIAEAQRLAAELGLPFCEECLKAQLAAKS